MSILLSEKGGISQAEIARIVGVSRQMINKYLKEARMTESPPPPKTAFAP
ncbi:MAG: winged helix-turn-helix domain-containing protein [Hyphomicrobiales bacterium]|nr:winged helix-turn-helix domain-containing protein [Hyphomicrobiales bacterium]